MIKGRSDENYSYNPSSPYSATKISADQLAISYYRSFNSPIKIVRPFNTYGPRQSARAVIPTIITQLINDPKELKLGNISPTRDLTHVHDTSNGFIEILKSDKLYGEVTNIGMNQEISIAELIQLISKIMNVEYQINSSKNRIRPDNSEVERLLCDNSKLLKHTSWEPRFDIKSGIKNVIEWISIPENLAKYKHNSYNV